MSDRGEQGRRLFFAGRNVAQAVLVASRQLGIPAEELAYKPREKRHGFVRVTRRVVIEVDPEHPRRTPPAERLEPVAEAPARRAPSPRPEPPPPAPRREPAVEEAPLPVEAVGRHAEAAREAASRLLSLAGLPAGVRVLARPDRLDVDLSGAGEPRLLAHDGELLLAIEHLLPRVVRGLVGEPVAVRADCGSFQEIKERRLRELALSVAAEVRRRGLPHTLQELGPAERRIIHLELAADPTVTTESVGEGYYKRITVRPAG